MSYKDPEKGLICGLRVLLLGLSPAFFAIKISFYGGFRQIKYNNLNNHSEADNSTASELFVISALSLHGSDSRKPDPMCKSDLKAHFSHT